MADNDPRLRLGATGPGSGLLSRIVGAALGAVVLVVSLLFSAVVFSFLLAAAVLIGGYFWWRTRDVRRQLREQMAQMDAQMRAGTTARPGDASRSQGGTVLDGDFIRERDDNSTRDSGR